MVLFILLSNVHPIRLLVATSHRTQFYFYLQPTPCNCAMAAPEDDAPLVLVTGASGFVATHIVQQLQEQGQYRVKFFKKAS